MDKDNKFLKILIGIIVLFVGLKILSVILSLIFGFTALALILGLVFAPIIFIGLGIFVIYLVFKLAKKVLWEKP